MIWYFPEFISAFSSFIIVLATILRLHIFPVLADTGAYDVWFHQSSYRFIIVTLGKFHVCPCFSVKILKSWRVFLLSNGAFAITKPTFLICFRAITFLIFILKHSSFSSVIFFVTSQAFSWTIGAEFSKRLSLKFFIQGSLIFVILIG